MAAMSKTGMRDRVGRGGVLSGVRVLAVRGGGTVRRWSPTRRRPRARADQQASVAFFDDGRMHEVRLWMSDDDFTSILEDSRGDEMRSATFSIDGVVMARVGIRPSGESSRVPGNQKMSMRIEFDAFDAGKKMGGVDEIKLSGSWDDPFIVRDRLAYWVYRQVMPAPRETAAQVWVNGQPRGIFEIEEVWGKEALASRFTDPSGPLYRLRGLTNLDPYEYKGDDPAAYVPLPWDVVGRATPDPAGRGHPRRAEGGGGGARAHRRRVRRRRAADLLRGQRDPLEHRRFHGAVRGRRSLPVLRPGDGTLLHHALGSRQHLRLAQRSARRRHLPQLRALRDHPDDRGRPAAGAVLRQAGGRDEPGAGLGVKDQADAIVAQIGDAARYDTTKMYPTESFVWSLGYVKDWTDGRYASLRAQIAAKRAAGDGRCAVKRWGRIAIVAAAVLSLAACGGGDQPGATDNACGFRDGEPNGSAGQATVVQPGATFDGCLEASDVDFLMLPSPDDEMGGYVQATVTPAMGTVRVTIYDRAGQAELGSFVADAPGAALSFYWASGSSQETRIAIRDDAGGARPTRIS